MFTWRNGCISLNSHYECCSSAFSRRQRNYCITPVKADGKVNPNILAAAEVCGIETIYKVGGAQGVAAVAYGTVYSKLIRLSDPEIFLWLQLRKSVMGW